MVKPFSAWYKRMEGADPVSFQQLEENENATSGFMYAKDKSGIFINDKILSKADPASFKVLNEKYAMDKNAVFFGLKEVKAADLKTFKVYPHDLGDADAEDKNHRYSNGEVLK